MINQKLNNIVSKTFQKISFKNNATRINIEEKLRKSININGLDVSTVNGDCGQGFLIKIRSIDFLGKSLLDQHRMINEIIKDEVKVIHSVVLQTRS